MFTKSIFNANKGFANEAFRVSTGRSFVTKVREETLRDECLDDANDSFLVGKMLIGISEKYFWGAVILCDPHPQWVSRFSMFSFGVVEPKVY